MRKTACDIEVFTKKSNTHGKWIVIVQILVKKKGNTFEATYKDPIYLFPEQIDLLIAWLKEAKEEAEKK